MERAADHSYDACLAAVIARPGERGGSALGTGSQIECLVALAAFLLVGVRVPLRLLEEDLRNRVRRAAASA